MASLKVWAIVALCVMSIAAVPGASAVLDASGGEGGDTGGWPPAYLRSECDAEKDILEQILCTLRNVI